MNLELVENLVKFIFFFDLLDPTLIFNFGFDILNLTEYNIIILNIIFVITFWIFLYVLFKIFKWCYYFTKDIF